MDRDRRAAAAAAVASLRGLAVGDALGSCFFVPANLPALRARVLPPDELWRWTDDAEMACSIFAVLARHGRIDQDALAESFAAHHDFDRGYGPGVNRMLRLIRQEGASWRELAASAFDGRGSWGNGAAMRVAPLGAFFAAADADAGHDADHAGQDAAGSSAASSPAGLELVAAEAAASAEVTHMHPEAVAGAIAVAVAAAFAVSRPDLAGAPLLRAVVAMTPAGSVRDGLRNAAALLPLSDPLAAARELGNGRAVSAPDTVPFPEFQ